MSMTKKEQAAFQALLIRAETVAALRWTDSVDRDLPAPEPCSGALIQGWDFNVYTGLTYEAWSTSIANGSGRYGDRGMSGSRGKLSLFSSEFIALRALRHRTEQEAAKKLMEIDRKIKEARHV